MKKRADNTGTPSMFSYKINAGVVTCRASGTLDFLTVAHALRALLHDVAATGAPHLTVVVEDVPAFESLCTLGSLRPLLTVWSQRPNIGKWAVVLPDEHALGRVESYLYILRQTGLEVEGFLNEEGARHWIAEHSLGVLSAYAAC